MTQSYEVVIRWTWEDIQELRPQLSQNECEAALKEIGKILRDRSFEEGWTILHDLLEINGL